MSYQPNPAKMEALGFAVAHESNGFDPSVTYRHPSGPGVVLWPNDPPEVRLFRHPHNPWANWAGLYEGPVADEAAFDALVQQHFPELITPQP